MNHAHQQKDYDSESLSVFVLRDVPNKEYAELYRLEDLVDPLDHCSMCKRKTHYTSVDEAVQHLMQFHMSKSGQKLEHIREKLTHWVVSASGADLENSNQLVIRYLNTLSQQIEMLQTKFVDLRNSVANENNEKPEGYLLPSALVKAAENFFQILFTSQKHDLRDLYLLEEELELVEAIYDAQRLALKTYGKVIDHGSYRITNRERVQTNENIERRILNRYLVEKPLPGLRYDYKDLQNQLTKTAQVLRYGIEIAEEGNTKAIRVFTLVTIIFLPLSFISSVFGMNTVDIRDMENTQGLFWAIAIPTTALIGGLSLLIAYRGTQMWDWLQNQSHTVHVNVAGTILDRRAYVKRRKQRPKDEEVLAGDDEELVERWMHGLHTKRRTGVRR
ncbi:hypothetical protein J4E83_001013 [Alternaria metachromatica]|uniref:uncharacterized protein n=1 Tax=Alternaria metachromatica TaxID=283354 RepID=UPI0020C29533|nr:uncharacterized protein J4E83_001013 [Alternaria metachromatica]KAI4636059.1 hypothetical protein J4E83_001013 [Alternaria metachromatica]